MQNMSLVTASASLQRLQHCSTGTESAAQHPTWRWLPIPSETLYIWC